MTLVWKLLRRHVSIPQLAGFFVANLMGMFIVMLSLQFYQDVKPVFGDEDGFIKSEYLILSKKIAATSVIGLGGSNSFSQSEIGELEQQGFTRSVGRFTASQYKVSCRMGLEGVAQIGTEMFFESVPDRFVDTDLTKWKFTPEEGEVPIILPKTYLAIYNFGFAQSQSLPKLSESIVGLVDMSVVMRGNGMQETMRAKVIGFSSRLNTILVPESFIEWSNARFAPEADTAPNRLILEVKNPTDDAIVQYINKKGYELEDDKLDAGRTTYFLRIVSLIVMSVGLLISILSFYILMLSIYLLVQKNTEKLRNLLLIGYSPMRVSLPYQLLTLCMNGGVFCLSLLMLVWVRGMYMDMIWKMFPQAGEGSMLPAFMVGFGLFLMVSLMNVVAVRSRVMKIWNRKE